MYMTSSRAVLIKTQSLKKNCIYKSMDHCGRMCGIGSTYYSSNILKKNVKSGHSWIAWLKLCVCLVQSGTWKVCGGNYVIIGFSYKTMTMLWCFNFPVDLNLLIFVCLVWQDLCVDTFSEFGRGCATFYSMWSLALSAIGLQTSGWRLVVTCSGSWLNGQGTRIC